MKSFCLYLCLLGLGLLLGCAQGNCRSQISQPAKMEGSLKNPSNPTDRVKVFKYDGSLQCGQGKAISVDEMAKQLGGIQIYSSVNKSDGLMHIQQCGTPTGKANVYEINVTDLEVAQKAGFKQWTWD